MKTLLLALLALPAFAQSVDISYSPLPAATAKVWFSQTKGLSIINVLLKNNSTFPVKLSPVDAKMSCPLPIQFLTWDQGMEVLTQKVAKNKKQKLIEYGGYAILAVSALTGSGAITMAGKDAALLAMGVGLSHEIGDRLRSTIPSLGPIIGSPFREPITLDAGESREVVMFAGATVGVKPGRVTIPVPTPNGPAILPAARVMAAPAFGGTTR